MENIKDWCISRQLWWGHRIPAYYLPEGQVIVAKNKTEAINKAKELYGINLSEKDIKQDEDVLDTWFSSWLWPISVFDGIRYPDNKDIKYYYPTELLITAPEILFFWVARMIMAGLEYRKEIPFKNVYLTGIVRDKIGRKMSKSLGNSPDPLDLIDKYGADGVRIGMLFCSPAGNDLLFDEILCEQGRNFCNKIWNAFRLIKCWNIDHEKKQSEENKLIIIIFDNLLNKLITEVEDCFEKFRVSDALMLLYRFFWDEFCSWYLEIIKPSYGDSIDNVTYKKTIEIYNKLLKLLHPYMPFITEEVWHLLNDINDENELLILQELPVAKEFDKKIEEEYIILKNIVTNIRNIRKEKNIQNKEKLELFYKNNNTSGYDEKYNKIISKLCNLKSIQMTETKIEHSNLFTVYTSEFYIPINGSVNIEEQIKKLEEELNYINGFINSVKQKLQNESFVNKAPQNVVDRERKKLKDAEAKISILEDQLKLLKGK